MKYIRLYTLLALLLMVGGVTMQGQALRHASDLFDCRKPCVTNAIQQRDDGGRDYDWLYYDNGICSENLAYRPENIPFSWAVMFPDSMLQSYAGYTLNRVAMYENQFNSGHLWLSVYYGNDYMPLTLMSRQWVAADNLMDWWEYPLDQPVEIDTTQNLWIVFTEDDFTETYSATCSYNDNPNPNARWVQTEANKWEDVANYNPYYYVYLQFMIRAYVTNDFLGVEEPLAYETTDVYPNPGGNTLNIRTDLQNARVEVYDTNGRLIHSQALTQNVTAIDATDWAEGVYVWKVYQTGPSTGSGTLAETGKWVKCK